MHSVLDLWAATLGQSCKVAGFNRIVLGRANERTRIQDSGPSQHRWQVFWILDISDIPSSPSFSFLKSGLLPVSCLLLGPCWHNPRSLYTIVDIQIPYETHKNAVILENIYIQCLYKYEG